MQAVILAAGKGTRLAPLTDTIPKPLITVGGVSIIDRVINALPTAIDDIIVVIGHHSDQLKLHLTTNPRAGIRCVLQQSMGGTYGALASARDLLSGSFLVTNGDDLQSHDELAELCKSTRAFCVSRQTLGGYHTIETNANNIVTGMRPQTAHELRDGALIATGTYMLDTEFFDLTPHQMKNGEYGIPHTLLANKERYPMRAFKIHQWNPINTPDDLMRAERSLS